MLLNTELDFEKKIKNNTFYITCVHISTTKSYFSNVRPVENSERYGQIFCFLLRFCG